MMTRVPLLRGIGEQGVDAVAMNIAKHVAHWRNSGMDDWEVAEILIQKMKYRQGLFFAHLTLEKLLKAHATIAMQTVPPKSHDLPYLLKKAALQAPPEVEEALKQMNRYNMEGRYTEQPVPPLNVKRAHYHFSMAREAMKWLDQKFPIQ